MNSMTSRFSALLVALFVPLACAKVEIQAMRHDIQLITAQNFDGVIGKFRDSQISSLWFFHESNKQDEAFLDAYNAVATELKGMAKITAISCDEYPVFCKKNDVKESTLMIYPINPMPAFKFEGKMETKAISSRIAKMIPDATVRLTKENMDSFLTTDPTKPKVVLFSNKKNVPTVWKALSSETVFKRTMKFAFATEDDADVIARFKVKKFPTVVMQRGQKAEIRDVYAGEMKFTALKDWANAYSESGVGDKAKSNTGGDKEEQSLEEAKPWLVQEVPELTAKSQGDICFKGEGLCVIYLKDGEASQPELDMLAGLKGRFTSQLSDRGAKMKWMWMNLAVETAFKELFEASQMPSAVVFNPHKRLRFTKLDHGEDGEIKGNEAGMTKLLDKVLGGDARFTIVKGQKLPAWAKREEAPKKKTEL